MSSNNHRLEKVKTITVTLTDKEVDAMEDAMFCQNSDEWYEENWKYMSSIFKKIAGEFDKEDS